MATRRINDDNDAEEPYDDEINGRSDDGDGEEQWCWQRSGAMMTTRRSDDDDDGVERGWLLGGTMRTT